MRSDSGLLGRVVSWFDRRPNDASAPSVEQRLEVAFHALHREFERREKRLDERIESFRQEQLTFAKSKSRRLLWIMPLGAGATAAMGYLLYLMTGMQGSMLAMSGNMEQMAGDTRVMAKNIQTMNGSMSNLNGNMGQMNQQMRTISQAAAPMGQAAQSFAPMTGMMKSFLPF